MNGYQMKLGVICDGISRNLKHALKVMDEFNLEYAELQYIDEKEVGDHSREEINEIKNLYNDVEQYKKERLVEAGSFQELVSLKLKIAEYERQLYYYKLLKPWTHYIPVNNDFSDLEEKLIWSKNNISKSLDIAYSGYITIFKYLNSIDNNFINTSLRYIKNNTKN